MLFRIPSSRQVVVALSVAACACGGGDPFDSPTGAITVLEPVDSRPPHEMLGPRWSADSIWAVSAMSLALGRDSANSATIQEVCLSRAGAVFTTFDSDSLLAVWVPVHLDGLNRSLQPLPVRGVVLSSREELMRHAARSYAPDSARMPLLLRSECRTDLGSAFYFLGEGVLDWDLAIWSNGVDALPLQ